MTTDRFKSTVNTQAVEREIRSAFRAWSYRAGCTFSTVYEHGQWWVLADSLQDETGCDRFSVNDATGPGSIFGFSFEAV